MLYDKITEDMKNSMKNHDKETLSTIRMLKSAIDLYKINNKMDRLENPSDDVVITVVCSTIKSHKDSIEEFKKANREDLVKNLEKEIEYLNTYLPEQLSDEEIDKVIDEVFEKIKPTSSKDMGLIMKELTNKLKGSADMKIISNKVKNKINAI